MQTKRELGKSGIMITPLMLGGNVFGWTADEAASAAVLDSFVDQGGNAIDTAEAYQMGAPDSETVIGNWLRTSGKRNRVVIATKVGLPDRVPGLRADNIIAACEGSLRRLGVDMIDLYQLHMDDLQTPPEEFLGALQKLMQAGKVRAIGASQFKADRLEAAVGASADGGLPPFSTLQPEYNLLARDIESDLMPFCLRESISLIPFFGLAMGYLTGKYRSAADASKSVRGAYMERYMTGKGPAMLAALDEVAARRGATPAQVALAWVMVKPGIAAPIASATSVAQLNELIGALQVELSADDIAALDGAGA